MNHFPGPLAALAGGLATRRAGREATLPHTMKIALAICLGVNAVIALLIIVLNQQLLA